MSWIDRTPAEQAEADQEAAAYDATDDDKIYVLTDGNARYTVCGINSANAVMRKLSDKATMRVQS